MKDQEFKVGDLVVNCGSIHWESKSYALWIVNRVLQTTIPCIDVTPLSKHRKLVHAGNQVAVSQRFRHATQSEIAAGHRIDQSNTDDVADFGYHVSPLTVVTELHVNEALRLNELG